MYILYTWYTWIIVSISLCLFLFILCTYICIFTCSFGKDCTTCYQQSEDKASSYCFYISIWRTILQNSSSHPLEGLNFTKSRSVFALYRIRKINLRVTISIIASWLLRIDCLICGARHRTTLMFKLRQQRNWRLRAHRPVHIFVAEGWHRPQLLYLPRVISVIPCNWHCESCTRCCCGELHSRRRAAIQRGASSRAAIRHRLARRTWFHWISSTMIPWRDICARRRWCTDSRGNRFSRSLS